MAQRGQRIPSRMRVLGSEARVNGAQPIRHSPGASRLPGGGCASHGAAGWRARTR